MKVNQISSELSADILAISELAHDQSISDAERAKKIDSLKASIVEKIDAESDAISFAGRSYLEKIQTIISNEEWATLPPTKEIKNELLSIRNLVSVLNSLEADRGPMIEAIQRLLTEALLKQLNSLSDSEALALSKQWGAAEIQFQKAKESAEAERQSSLMTAGIGIGTALVSLAAKVAVTRYSNNKFKETPPDMETKNQLNDAVSEQNKAELNFNGVSKKMSALDDDLAKARGEVIQLKKDLNNDNLSPAEKASKQTELDNKNANLNVLQKRRNDLTPEYKKLKVDYQVASKVTDRKSAELERINAERSRAVQQFRALLDMSDSGMSILQNIGKMISVSLFDSKASDLKIESDKAAFLVNFFASGQQNAQKSQSQTSDGIASLRSMCDASIQAADSSISYTIKA